MTRTRRGNWDRDYTTAMTGGMPDERRRLLIDRGILPEENNENGREYIISCDVAEPTIEFPSWEELVRATRHSCNNYNEVNRHVIRGGRINTSIISYDEAYSFKHIRPYNYKPDKFNFNKIYGSDDMNPYLGVELEVEIGRAHV